MENTGLQVRFTFSDELMEANNIKREDVYHTLKKNFEQRGLVCISEDEVLAFKDTGAEDDYANMWVILMALIEGDWFTKCAASCDFIEDDDVEDVLIQIPEIRKMLGLTVSPLNTHDEEEPEIIQEDMENMGLQVRFTFSDELMEANDIKREDVYYTLKKHFEQRGLVCISEDEVLAFKDTGDEDDYGNMWAILIALIKGDWFIKCAASCDFIEDGDVEDILIQIPELKKNRFHERRKY